MQRRVRQPVDELEDVKRQREHEPVFEHPGADGTVWPEQEQRHRSNPEHGIVQRFEIKEAHIPMHDAMKVVCQPVPPLRGDGIDRFFELIVVARVQPVDAGIDSGIVVASGTADQHRGDAQHTQVDESFIALSQQVVDGKTDEQRIPYLQR